MDEDFYLKMQKLISNINLKKVNLSLVKNNIKKLINIYIKLKIIWDKFDENKIKYNIISNKNSYKFKEILNIINKNFISNNQEIKKFLSNVKYLHYLNFSNINFYWISESDDKDFNNKNYLLSVEMFKMTYCLNLYNYKHNDKIIRNVIWIPINKKRDYKYKSINKVNLNKVNENFEAFVASGVTFGINPKITIITRYEEVEKLLIHELIHNYNMDGSGFHNELNDILIKYEKIKNEGNYHYEYSMYESYTEMLSTYIYMLFENIKFEIKLNELNEKLLSQILLEIIYSYNLICNLIKLNGYKSYNEFRSKIIFSGNICKYEYYYIKALMYNNWNLKLGNDINDYYDIYNSIIDMINNNKKEDDKLLYEIYFNFIDQKNYKYQIR